MHKLYEYACDELKELEKKTEKASSAENPTGALPFSYQRNLWGFASDLDNK